MKTIEHARAAEHSFQVTADHSPKFEGKEVHPVCSTYKLAQEAEWAGRRVLLPLLDFEEDGIGISLHIEHKAPAPIGAWITLSAQPVSLTGNKLICSFEARFGELLVASGTTTQAILLKSVIDKLLKNN